MTNLKQIIVFSLLPISLLSLLLFLLPSSQNHHHHHNRRHDYNYQHRFPLPSPFLNSLIKPPPRIAYFLTGTNHDGPRMFRLLQAIYHPRNYYLLHLDQSAPREQRVRLSQMVGSVDIFVAADNVNLVGNVNAVNEDGSSPLALVLHGAAMLMKWKMDWDWFINLDSSDYPLLPQDDIIHVLSFVPRHLNFIEYSTNMSSQENDRMKEIIVDPRIYLGTKGRMFTADKKRQPPNAFQFFTGSEHVILSRKFVEFSVIGWDNLPRRLLMYLTNTKYAHRGFFQTVCCNSKEFLKTVINSNLRFNWKESTDYDEIYNSGAAFAGNVGRDDTFRDMIDWVVLDRSRGRNTPGGWCLGKSWWGGDTCLEWGDFNILRPTKASKRFENLLLESISNTTMR